MKSTRILVIGVLLAPLWGVAQDEKPVEQILECAAGNVPAPGSIRAVRLTARDRIGSKRVTRLQIQGHRTKDGRRRVLVRFLEPPEMVGASLLFLEGEDENQVYYMSPELERPKRLTGAERTLELFGTDFSYEDFERLEALTRPGASQRLEDDAVAGRPAYVVHTFPADRAASDYGAVVSHFDQKTCVPLKMEMFDRNGVLKKQLLANPDQVHRRGQAWIPQQANRLRQRGNGHGALHRAQLDHHPFLSALKASAVGFRRTSPSAQ